MFHLIQKKKVFFYQVLLSGIMTKNAFISKNLVQMLVDLTKRRVGGVRLNH